MFAFLPFIEATDRKRRMSCEEDEKMEINFPPKTFWTSQIECETDTNVGSGYFLKFGDRSEKEDQSATK